VFRFNIKNSTTVADLVLGNAFVPGKSAKSFCKPTSVAALENGDFFVADGYCNARIVKYSFSGEKLLEVRTAVHLECSFLIIFKNQFFSGVEIHSKAIT
jgi:hypothetical protein